MTEQPDPSASAPVAEAAAEPIQMYELEPPVPLASSMVWHLQRTFYADQGIEAWSRSKVPQSITTSPLIARAYARIVFGFLRDMHASIDPTQPVYIVELGAGSGRFAYRFLNAFTGLRDETPGEHPPFVYVMTDASPSVMDFWSNPRLQSFVERGVLDFGRFDLLERAPIELRHSKAILRVGDLVNPLVVFGNYIFDSIPQDSIAIKDGQLFANLVSVSASSPELDLKAPDAKVRIGIAFTQDDTPTDPDLEPDPVLREILRGYRERLSDTNVLVPRIALACIRHFQELSNNRALCIFTDFGDTREADLDGHGPPGFGAGGGLWLAVNFHALGEYTRGLGGQFRHPRDRPIRLNTSMLLFGPPGAPFTESMLAYADVVEHQGPDSLTLLARAVGEHAVALNFEALLALLRTVGWDSEWVVRCLPALLDALPKGEANLRQEVLRGVQLAWEQYYPIGEPDDLPFSLGALLYTLGRPAEALAYFEMSLRDFGEHSRTTLNIALSLYRLHRLEESLTWIDRTLALDPADETAQAMRQDVAAELES